MLLLSSTDSCDLATNRRELAPALTANGCGKVRWRRIDGPQHMQVHVNLRQALLDPSILTENRPRTGPSSLSLQKDLRRIESRTKLVTSGH